PQPAAEAALARLAAEAAEVAGDGAPHFLQEVGGVLVAQARAACPRVDQRAVQLNEALPGLGVLGPNAVEHAQRGITRRRLGGDGHPRLLRGLAHGTDTPTHSGWLGDLSAAAEGGRPCGVSSLLGHHAMNLPVRSAISDAIPVSGAASTT